MKIVLWRLWFESGASFSNLDGSWVDAPGVAMMGDKNTPISGPGPGNGVICCAVRDPSGTWGRWIMSGYAPPSVSPLGNDWYVKCPGENEPYAVDRAGLALFFDKVGGEHWELVKHGRMAPYVDGWQTIMAKAVDDIDFPRGTPRRRSTDWPSSD